MTIAPNSPNRCERVVGDQQCLSERMDGSKYCPYHTTTARNTKDKLRAYMLTNNLLSEPADRHVAAEELKSLREEIASLRGMCERRLNLLQNDAELVATMPAIQSAFVVIEKLVTSCHNMEVKLGKLIGKAALLTLAQKLVGVISEALKDVPNRNEIVDKLSDQIVELILQAENEDGK